MEALKFIDSCDEAHFSAMSLIHALGWRTTYADALPEDYMRQEVTDDRWVPYFRENAKGNSCHGLLLYKSDVPVACANYGPARTGRAPAQSSLVTFDSVGYEGWGEVVSFYVHPDEKRKGYGGLLLREVFRRLRADGFADCFVLVLRENAAARRFYEAHGFRWDGTHVDIPFPHETVCVDLRYVRSLSPAAADEL